MKKKIIITPNDIVKHNDIPQKIEEEEVQINNEYSYIEYEYLYKLLDNKLYYIIDNFIINEQYLFNLKNKQEKSNIDNILIKQILNYAKPIINSYPDSTLYKSDKVNNTRNSFNVRNNFTIQSYIYFNNKYTKFNIPANREFEIKGFSIEYKHNNNYLEKNILINEICDINYLSPFKERNGCYKVLNKIYKKNKVNRVLLQDKNNSNILSDIYDNILYNINFDEHHLYYLYNINNKSNQNMITNNLLIYKKNKLNLYGKNNYYNKIKLYSKDNNSLLKKLNELIEYKINYYYTNNLYSTLKNSNLHVLYEYSLIYGNDNKYIKDNIKILTTKNVEHAKKLINDKIMNNNIVMNIKFENIGKDKFPNLFNLNHKDNKFNDENVFNMSQLEKKYKDTILIEYKKLEKYNNEYLLNDCEHLDVLTNFRTTKDDETKRELFKKLLTYVEINTKNIPTTMLKCKKCKFDILCPHVYEYYKKLYEYDNCTLNTTKHEYNIKQYIISKYMSDKAINLIYYCKICSEELGKSFYIEQFQEFINNERVNRTNELDEIQLLILRNTYEIVNKNINLNNVMVKEKSFIYTIVEMLHNHISEININLNKSKMYTEEDKSNRLKLHTIIYIYSTLLYIINNNKDITFKNINVKKTIKGGEAVIKKKNIKESDNAFIQNKFKEGFYIIINTQNLLINKLKIQYAEIKQLLLQYYRNMSINKNISLNVKQEKHIFSIIDLLKISPIYNLVLNSNNIFPIKNNNIVANNKYDINNTVFLINKLFNKKDIKKLNKNSYLLNYDNLFGNINIPLYNKKYTPDNTNIKNDYEYKYFSHTSMFKYLMLNIFRYSPFLNQQKSYPSIILTDIKNYNEYNENCIKYEKKMIEINIKNNLSPFYYFKGNRKKINKFDINDININKFYDLNGLKHKFNLYALKNNNKIKIYNHGELLELLENTPLKKIKIEYRICSICKQLDIDIDNTSKDNIKKNTEIINTNILKNSELESFFNYFLFKCPKKTYHLFKADKCTYCDVTKDKLLNRDRKYFDTYYDQFKLIFSKKNIEKTKQLSNIRKVTNNNTYKNNIKNLENSLSLNDSYLKNITELNLSYIDRLSNFDKLNKNYLIKLGLLEKQNYKDIDIIKVESTKKPLELNNRYLKLINYLKYIIVYYNTFKASSRILKFNDYDMYLLLEKYKKNGLDLNKLKKLPSVNNNIFKLIEYYKLVYDIDKLNTIILNIIYYYLIFILDSGKKMSTDVNKISIEFVQLVLKKILHYDELTSNFDYQKIQNILYKKDKKGNVQEEVNDEGDKLLPAKLIDNYEDEEGAEEVNDLEDIFDYNGFDFDAEDEDNL